jgi:uncharacterized repeat protein (TIGR01451 family)
MSKLRSSINLGYGIFLVPGLFLLVFGGYYSNDGSLPATTAVHVGATLLVVAVIEVAWAKLGGAPVQRDVMQLKAATQDALSRLEEATDSQAKQTTDALGHLQRATDALVDLQESGIMRVHPEREIAITELADDWARWAENARQVDVLGLTLHRDWVEHEALKELTKKAYDTGRPEMRVVMLAYDPDRPPASYVQRSVQPGEIDNEGLLSGLLSASRYFLEPLIGEPKTGLKVRFSDRCTLYAMLIRIDDYMFVAPYLASTVGDHAFAFEVRGTNSPVFRLYETEFTSVFEDALPGYLVPSIEVDKPTAKPGDRLIYTLRVTNSGPGSIADCVIRARLPVVPKYADLVAVPGQPDEGPKKTSSSPGLWAWGGVSLACGDSVTRRLAIALHPDGWDGQTSVTSEIELLVGKRIVEPDHPACRATTRLA